MKIAEECDRQGCNDKLKKIHADLARRGWFAHPSEGFKTWWEPNGVNPSSGAETGGHREAYRKCVQPVTRAWQHYGIKTVAAFNIQRFRDEYTQWVADGEPPRHSDYDGTAATLEDQRNCFRTIKKILSGSIIISGAERTALTEL